MGDVGDMYNELKQHSKNKRAKNRASSAEILKEAGIKFDEKNFGAHLIVFTGGAAIDFWPGTGKWIVRAGGEGRGVHELIKLVKFLKNEVNK